MNIRIWIIIGLAALFAFWFVNIVEIKSNERIEMAKLKIVEKYLHEMERQDKLLEAARILGIKKKRSK